LHAGILHAVERGTASREERKESECAAGPSRVDLSTPRLLIFIVGVPGSGKTAILKRIAKNMIRLHQQGNQDPTLEQVLQQLDRPGHGGGCDETHVHVSADEMKTMLSSESVWSPTTRGHVINDDDMTRRANELRDDKSEQDVLVHSQYLHRESIFLADEMFLLGVRRRRHMVMEKTMTSFQQVDKYIDIVNNCSAGSPAGPCEASPNFKVVILAAEAELDACLRANDQRRQSGHVLTRRQIQTQHQRFRRTVEQLLGRSRQGSKEGPSTLTLWVFDTTPVLESLMRKEGLLEASKRIRLKSKSVISV